MQKVYIIFICFLCWFSTIGVAQHKNKTEVRELKLNLSRSTVRWKAEKIGGFHEGSLNFSSGEMKVENYSIKGGKFEIDMNSLTCTDIKDKSLNQKLINHLRSDDFFSIEKYPKAIFEIIQVVPNPRAEAAGNNYLVKGKLTIKGITQEIEFPATITFKDKGGITAFGDLKLDRTRWNIRYGSGKFFDNLGDKLIYDEFSVSFLIIAE